MSDSTSAAREARQALEAQWAKQKEEAERIATEVFPVKALELAQYYETHLSEVTEDRFWDGLAIDVTTSDEADTGPQAKRAKRDEAAEVDLKGRLSKAATNNKLKPLAERIRKELYYFKAQVNLLRVWIQLNIPRIEDGGNFGVGIQEETLAEVVRCENDAISSLEQFVRYSSNRAKMVSKCFKYPHLEDYQQAVKEIDAKLFGNMQLICAELRNNYSLLHDHITKNLEKIKHPRSSRGSAMVY